MCCDMPNGCLAWPRHKLYEMLAQVLGLDAHKAYQNSKEALGWNSIVR